MKYKPSILLLLLVLSTMLSAQEPHTWQLTDEDGLPSMEVYDLFQDSKKYIWIGTDKGICKYNGQDFQYYKHPKEKGTSATLIQEDGLGRIWYKNFNGQLFYIDQDSIHLFEVPATIGLNAYFEYLVNKEGVWIGGHSSYCFFNFKTKEHKKTAEAQNAKAVLVKQFYLLSEDTVIINFFNRGHSIYIENNNETKIWEQALRFEEKENKYANLWLYPYKQDSLIVILSFVNKNKSFYKIALHEHENISINYKKRISLAKDISDVFTDNKNNIWITNSKGGIQCFFNGVLSTLKQKIIFRSIPFSSIIQDHEGNYWLGTLDRGILIFSSTHIENYTKDNSKLRYTTFKKLSSDTENQLFLDYPNATIVGFNPKKDSLVEIATPQKEGRNEIVDLLFEKKQKELFFASIWGIGSFDIKTRIIKKSIAASGYGKLALYNKNNLLLGARLSSSTINVDYPKTSNCDSLDQDFCKNYKYDWAVLKNPNTAKRAYFREERTNAVWTDQKYPNRFWLGYHDSLLYYQNAIPFAILDEEGQTIQALDILQTADGILWVSTINSGVYGIENYTVKWHYTTKDGLPSNYCNNLTTDGQKLWISTDKGISYLNPKTRETYSYNKLDGLPTEEIKDLEYLDGKVWAASAKGLMSIDTNYNPINRSAPPIYITGLKINGIDTIVSNSSYELTYAQNNLVVEFEGLAYRSKGQYHYIYRLLGQDSTWVEQPAAAPFVRLDQLRAGVYQFEVKTVNEDGIESENAAFVSFKINPPFWQTWWFYGLCVLAGIGIIVGLVIWRYERIRKEEAIELTRIRAQERVENELNELRAEAIESRMQALQSQMNPHFVFNAMTAIQNYWLQNKTSFALRYHAKFAKLMRFIFDYSNKEAITLKKEIEFLELYTTLEQMRFSQTIEIVWDIEEELLDGEFSIPPLLIQPIIENCFKHGFFHKEAAGELTIKFRKKDIYLHCNIIDNGVGRANVQAFQKGQKRDANRNSGLLVTKQRLAILHKDKIPCIENPILIHDLKDRDRNSGTCVELFIPFV